MHRPVCWGYASSCLLVPCIVLFAVLFAGAMYRPVCWCWFYLVLLLGAPSLCRQLRLQLQCMAAWQRMPSGPLPGARLLFAVAFSSLLLLLPLISARRVPTVNCIVQSANRHCCVDSCRNHPRPSNPSNTSTRHKLGPHHPIRPLHR